MGSRRRGRDTIKPWLSARLDCKEGRFVQVGNSLLLSKEFQALTAGARFLYLCMTMESAGKREFILYKSNDYLKKSPVYGHFRKTAA